MKPIIFLTGATGFVGQNLLQKILDENPEMKLILLVRSENFAGSQIKIGQFVKKSEMRRIELVKGDVRLRQFGMTSSNYLKLAKRVTHVIHSAANTRFDLSLDEARRSNCIGTQNVMCFAEQVKKRGHLVNVAHISTAFVSGNRSGTIYEDDLQCAQKFSNTYEQSKYEAEQMIRQQFEHLPVTIFRPSIIVGHSKTGVTSNFNVLYYPLKLLYRGLLRVIPAWREVPMDVVPIDYVCNAIFHIIFHCKSAAGKTYHLTAGKEKTISVGELTQHASDYFTRCSEGHHIKVIRFISPYIANVLVNSILLFAGKLRKIVKIYGPYLTTVRVFDNSTTLADLNDFKLEPPAVSGYLDAILGYCIKTDWGKIVPANSI